MEQTIIKRLNYYYYGIMALALVVALACYFLIVKGIVPAIDPQSTLGSTIQYIIICDLLLTLPGGLYWHKRVCNRLSAEQDAEKQALGYERSARRRILLVSNTMVLAIAAFYLMGAYRSMLWVAAIAAIGWYFTKPTEGKMQQELLPPTENY
ncbi:MAG: hypothetical protein J6T85_02555 [Paludibacteraceae bacterium]|jgi:hypothetical protein|nr:hypothetical protein [Paludibacteraceae bacterium]